MAITDFKFDQDKYTMSKNNCKFGYEAYGSGSRFLDIETGSDQYVIRFSEEDVVYAEEVPSDIICKGLLFLKLVE